MLGALGDLGDFIGGIGVIVTLVYLAIQIRSNTEQTRLNTAGEAWAGILAAFEPVYYGDNVAIMQQGLAGTLDPEGPEHLTFSMLMVRTLGQFELALYQTRHGALDRELLDMYTRLIETFLTTPGGRRWWDESGSALFGSAFVAHVTAILERPSPTREAQGS